MGAIPEVSFGSNQVQSAYSGVEGILVPEVIDANKGMVLCIDIPIAADIQELRMLDRRCSTELRGGNADALKERLVCGADSNRNGKGAVQVLVCSVDEKFVFLDGTSGIHAVGIHEQVGLWQGWGEKNWPRGRIYWSADPLEHAVEIVGARAGDDVIDVAHGAAKLGSEAVAHRLDLAHVYGRDRKEAKPVTIGFRV